MELEGDCGETGKGLRLAFSSGDVSGVLVQLYAVGSSAGDESGLTFSISNRDVTKGGWNWVGNDIPCISYTSPPPDSTVRGDTDVLSESGTVEGSVSVVASAVDLDIGPGTGAVGPLPYMN